MSTIAPFKAFHYSKTIQPTDVIVPPYDNIPAGDEMKYFNRSPYNFAHVLLPRKDDLDYAKAADRLGRWKSAGVLVQDHVPSYYVYQQTFAIDGVSHRRNTLMATVLLHDFSEAIVRPHENTYGQFKEDRLAVLRKTQCNLSHIFGMVKDHEGFLQAQYEKHMFEAPLLSGRTDEGADHAIWQIDASRATEITQFFKEKPIYIVDGHHRYESSLMYARETGAVGDKKNPAAYMLFAIANAFDPALVVFPTHRVVTGLDREACTVAHIEKKFDLAPMSREALTAFVKRPQAGPQFALYTGGKLYLATAKWWEKESSEWGKTLARNSVVWSDIKLLKEICHLPDAEKSKKIHYEKDLNQTWEKRDGADLVVFHPPLAVEDVAHVADEKRFLPQKSTFFYPKLAAGLIMRDLRAQG